MKSLKLTIRSQTEFEGQPIWSFETTPNVKRSHDRVFAVLPEKDDQPRSLLHWRADTSAINKVREKPQVTVFGKLLQFKVGDPQDVLVAHMLPQPPTLEPLTLEQGAIKGSIPSKSPLSELLAEKSLTLNLHPLGLVFLADLGELGKLRVLLTSLAGDLVLTPFEPEPEAKLPPAFRDLLRAANQLRTLSSPAQWCDWHWQRPVLAQDLYLPLKRSGDKWKIEQKSVRLAADLVRVALRDRPAGGALAPLSRTESAAQRIEATIKSWQAPIEITSLKLSADSKSIEALAYQYSKNTETLNAASLTLHVASNLAERLAKTRSAGAPVRAFLPIKQGWLQLALAAVPAKGARQASVLPQAEPARFRLDSSAQTRDGLWELGTRRIERESVGSIQNQMPWSLRVLGLDGYELRFGLEAGAIATIKGPVYARRIVLRGLLWAAVGRPDDDDLLPQLELGSAFLRDLEFETGEADAPSWGAKVIGLSLSQEASVQWPTISFGQIELSKLHAAPVLWARHPRLPAIQMVPLTSAREAPVRALGSRELLPLELIGARTASMTGKLDQWPELAVAAPVRFWWPEGAPSTEDTAVWLENPDSGNASLVRGHGLAALSMPGVEFWPDVRSDQFRCAFRTDLPYIDEFYANARLPKEGVPGAAVPGAVVPGEVVPGEVAAASGVPFPDLALGADAQTQALWLARHDAWMLSLGRTCVLVDRAGDLNRETLLPGFSWSGGAIQFAALPGPSTNPGVQDFGTVTVKDDPFSSTLSGARLLEGLNAGVELTSNGLKLTNLAAAPKMLGFALPAIAYDGQTLDGDGALSKLLDPTTMRQEVRIDGQPYTRITLAAPLLFKLGGRAHAFWCRELPCTANAATLRFKKNIPAITDGDYGRLSGYEWRLYSADLPSTADLSLDAHFLMEPLALELASFDGTHWNVTLNGWLKPAIKPDLRLGLVKIKLQLTETASVESLESIGNQVWSLPELLKTSAQTAPLTQAPRLTLSVQWADGKVQCQSPILHLPVFGHWQKLSLKQNPSVSGFCFELQSSLGNEVKIASATLNISAPSIEISADLSMQVELVTNAFHAVVHRSDPLGSAPCQYKVELKRFPGGAATPELDGKFDLLRDAGFAVVVARDANDYAPFPYFVISKARQRWQLGVVVGLNDSGLCLQHAYLEGQAHGMERKLDLLLTLISGESEAKWQHQTRLEGSWKIKSLINWPKAKVDKREVQLQDIKRSHVMTVAWAGQVLKGERFRTLPDGSIWPTCTLTPEIACEHRFAWGGNREFVFPTLERLVMGTLNDLEAWIQSQQKISVQNLGSRNSAGQSLSGFIGNAAQKGFPQAISLIPKAAREARQARIVLSTSMGLLSNHPIAFAFLGILDNPEWSAGAVSKNLGAHLSESLNKIAELGAVKELDSSPIKLSAVLSGNLLAQQLNPSSTTGGVPPIWEKIPTIRKVQYRVDDGVWIVQQQAYDDQAEGEYYEDYPFLRSKVWFSRLLDDPNGTTPKYLSLAIIDGRTLAFDAGKVLTSIAPTSAFADEPARMDIVVGGAYGLAVLGTNTLDVDPAWLSEAIQLRLGHPAFAILRSVNAADNMPAGSTAKVLPLASTLAMAPALPVRIDDIVPDSQQGPAKAPPLEHDTVAAASARTELLARAPLRVEAPQATTGTRHCYRLPSMAGAALQHLHSHQQRVIFSAPRAEALTQSGVRAEWSSRIAAVPEPSEQIEPNAVSALATNPTQVFGHRYRETIAFAQRSGVMRLHREAIMLGTLSEHRIALEPGLSLAHAFRAPRPMALPLERQSRGYLAPGRLDVARGIADMAVVPPALLGNATGAALPTRFVLTGPENGVVNPNWNGEFVLAFKIFLDNPALPKPDKSKTYQWRASLLIDGQTSPLEVAVDSVKSMLYLRPSAGFKRPTPLEEQSGYLELSFAPPPPPQEPAQTALQEPATTLLFPLLFVSGKRFGLPMQAHTVTFYDPVFNDELASEVARAGGKTGTQVLVDRRSYNATGPMVLMTTGTNDNRSICFERLRRTASTGSLTVDSLQLGTGRLILKPEQPVRVDLAHLSIVNAESNNAVLQAGDMLRVFLESESTIQLLIPIAAEPILPPPEAAYALWQTDPSSSEGLAIKCPRYGAGVMPDRVDLIDAKADLKAGRVRRFALFRWIIILPRWIQGSQYYLQRIDHIGASHFPTGLSDFKSAELTPNQPTENIEEHL